MRTFTILFAALTLAACGGSDAKTADAKLAFDAPVGGNPDAPTATPDAPNANTSTGLGQVCAGNNCPAEANMCVDVGGTNTFCTLSCGTGPVPAQGQQPTPPTGGNAICEAAYNGTSGTLACVLTGTAANNMIPWSCGILCGTYQTQDFGTCTNGLVCTDNFCQ